VRFSASILLDLLSLQSGLTLPRERTAPLSYELRPLGLTRRILLLALLFAAELTVISILLDTANLATGGNLLPILRSEGAWLLRCIVGFTALFITFAYLKNRAALDQISSEVAGVPVK